MLAEVKIAMHGVFTRTDYILISKDTLPFTVSCNIGNSLVCNHTTVMLNLVPADNVKNNNVI